MISGLFPKFLDHDKLNIELCDAPSDTPLLTSDSVQKEIKACQIICGLHVKSAEAKTVFSHLCVSITLEGL